MSILVLDDDLQIQTVINGTEYDDDDDDDIQQRRKVQNQFSINEMSECSQWLFSGCRRVDSVLNNYRNTRVETQNTTLHFSCKARTTTNSRVDPFSVSEAPRYSPTSVLFLYLHFTLKLLFQSVTLRLLVSPFQTTNDPERMKCWVHLSDFLIASLEYTLFLYRATKIWCSFMS